MEWGNLGIRSKKNSSKNIIQDNAQLLRCLQDVAPSYS
jgi:hypothetical protein